MRSAPSQSKKPCKVARVRSSPTQISLRTTTVHAPHRVEQEQRQDRAPKIVVEWIVEGSPFDDDSPKIVIVATRRAATAKS
jgi:hypothetical protein